MKTDAKARRRWLGALVLALDLAMLVAGQTILKSRLQGLAFLFYWLVCFALTAAAMISALADARVLLTQSRREERQLMQRTLKQIEDHAGEKRQPAKNKSGFRS